MTEREMQAILMEWLFDKKGHRYIVPNVADHAFYYWECDVLSVTKAGLIHEWEIKTSRSDYRRDFEKKPAKHLYLQDERDCFDRLRPSYFWFATNGIAIEPPRRYGWVKIENGEVVVMRPAVKLHSRKIDERQKDKIARAMTCTIKNRFMDAYR